MPSSMPRWTFIDCTAAPLAPLPRLSRRHISSTCVALAAHYEGERFVRVMPFNDANVDGGYFDVQACNDTNRVELFVFANPSQVLLMCRLDNLGKGASGAAVQSMNVHLGIDETTGLA